MNPLPTTEPGLIAMAEDLVRLGAAKPEPKPCAQCQPGNPCWFCRPFAPGAGHYCDDRR